MLRGLMKNIIKSWLKDHGIDIPDDRIKLLEIMIRCYLAEESLDKKNEKE
jgi:hypothetical protein